MRKKRVINWMVILSILLTGCKQKKDTLQTLLPPLVKAEHIMYEYPDSALHILQEMQMPASSDKLQTSCHASKFFSCCRAVLILYQLCPAATDGKQRILPRSCRY